MEEIYKRLDRIEAKTDKIIDNQSDHNATLARLTTTVEIHESRSTKLEAIVLPMKSKWDMAEGAMKLVGGIATLVGVIAGIIKVLDFIHKL